MAFIPAIAEFFIAAVIAAVVTLVWLMLGPAWAVGMKLVVFPSIIAVVAIVVLVYDGVQELRSL